MGPTEQGSLPLPGLEPPVDDPTGGDAGRLALAVRRSIRALDNAGLIHEVDAARLQLALELADIIEIKKATRRMSTVGNDARVLVDLLDKLLPEQTETDEELRAAIAAWSAHVAPPAP